MFFSALYADLSEAGNGIIQECLVSEFDWIICNCDHGPISSDILDLFEPEDFSVKQYYIEPIHMLVDLFWSLLLEKD